MRSSDNTTDESLFYHYEILSQSFNQNYIGTWMFLIAQRHVRKNNSGVILDDVYEVFWNNEYVSIERS